MKMAGRLLAATLLSLAVGCQGEGGGTQEESPLKAQEAKAEAQCVERFEGITTCAKGNAKVSASEKGIDVSGITDPKRDGVSSNFAGAIGWTQQTTIPVTGKSQLSLAARDGDQVVSTLRVAPGRAENQLAVMPSFTGTAGGSQYRVNVYQDGVLVGSGNYEPQTYIIIIIWRWWWWWWWDFYSWRAVAANDSIADGACVWRINAGDGDFSVQLDGKEVHGNRLELVEVIGDGHYPYTSFSGIDVTGQTGDFTILNESIRRE